MVGIVSSGNVIIFSSMGRLFHITPLPFPYLATIVGLAVLYLIEVVLSL